MEKKKRFEEFWEHYVNFYNTIQQMYDLGVDLWESSLVTSTLSIADTFIVSLFSEQALDIFSNFVVECYELTEDDCDELYNLLICES